jgi:hypothetical protein
MTFRTTSLRLFSLLAAVLAFSAALDAQTGTGAISGAVTDQSGAVVPNANITITNKATGTSRQLITNAEGLYSAPALLAGEYEVKVELSGFRTAVRSAQVLAGSDTTASFGLTPSGTREVITVEAATAQINYDTHTVEGSIERQSIQELPLNGRNFTQLATLQPGVTVVAGATSSRNSPIAVTVLGGSGAFGAQTLMTLDGLKIMDEYDGTGGQINFSQELVQEFQLSQVNFDLSTGITSVGAINIVSRSGGNDFHGSGFFYYRDHNMAAYPGLKRSALNPDPYFARRTPGFYIGGPIKKDRLFFFFNFERQSQVQAVTVQPDLPSFSPLAGIFSSPQTYKSLNTRLDYRVSPRTSIFARYTHDGNVTFGQNAGAPPLPSNWLNNDNWSDQSAIGVTTILTPNMVNDVRFGYNYWRSNNPIARPDQCQFPCIGAGLPSTGLIGSIFIAGIAGNNFNAPQNRIQRNLDLVEQLSWQKGKHRLRFGADIEDAYYFFNWYFCQQACLYVVPREVVPVPGIPSKISSAQDLLNLPVYNLPPSLYGGIGIGPSITPGPYNFNSDRQNWRPHLYAQDTWKIRANLTVNYGLGYQYESGLFNSDMPKPAFLTPIFGADNLRPTQPNKTEFSPSFGFAWSPGKSSKTVLRGGAGLYWDTVPIYWRSRENGEIGPLGNGRVNITAGAFQNIFPGIVNVLTGRAINVGDPLPVNTFTNLTLGQFLQIYNQQYPTILQKVSSLRPITSGPYMTTDLDILKTASEIFPSNFPLQKGYQTSLGIQRELGHNMVLTADWARRQFEHVSLGEIDLNHFSAVSGPVIPACTTSQLFVAGQECSTGGITVWTPEGRSIFEGLLVRLDRRYSNHFQFTASYALQNLNNVTVVNLNNYFQGYGPSLPRHNLNVSGTADFRWGFQLSVNSAIISRTPVQPSIAGADLSGTLGSGGTGPLPGNSYRCYNVGCSKTDLQAAVDKWNSNYAGTKGPYGTVLPKVVLPPDYQLGDPFFSQDFRVTKSFTYKERYQLKVFSEFFNAFNIANLTGYSFALDRAAANPVAQTYSFGQPTQRAAQSFLSGGPRAIQVGARFSF